MDDPITATSQAELLNVLKLANQNTSLLIKTLGNSLASQSAQRSALAISYSTTDGSSLGATLVTASTTYLVSVSVLVASTGAVQGTIHDCGTTANTGSSSIVAVISSAVGTTVLNWPIERGIVIAPSSQSQVISVSFT